MNFFSLSPSFFSLHDYITIASPGPLYTTKNRCKGIYSLGLRLGYQCSIVPTAVANAMFPVGGGGGGGGDVGSFDGLKS